MSTVKSPLYIFTMLNKFNVRTATTLEDFDIVEGLSGGRLGLRSSQTRLHAPDLTGVLADGAVTGELATTSNVVDDHLGPFFSILFENQEEKQASSQFQHCCIVSVV